MTSVEIRRGPHGYECDWGTFQNSEANPTRGLKHLMAVRAETIRNMIDNGPVLWRHGDTHSVTTHNGRLFAHIDYQGQRTTWELFKAHFANGRPPFDMYIGKWPD